MTIKKFFKIILLLSITFLAWLYFKPVEFPEIDRDIAPTVFKKIPEDKIVEIKYSSTKKESKTSQKTLIMGIFELPPEPDPNENLATLGGVDSNNNMVRDDIERAILLDNNFFVTPELKAAGLQAARVNQHLVTIENFPDLNIANMIDFNSEALTLLLLLSGSQNKDLNIYRNAHKAVISFFKKLDSDTFNTPKRKKYYYARNSYLSGSIITVLESGKFSYRQADFDIAALRDKTYNWNPNYYTDRPLAVYIPDIGTFAGVIYKSSFYKPTMDRKIELELGYKTDKKTAIKILRDRVEPLKNCLLSRSKKIKKLEILTFSTSSKPPRSPRKRC